ncbi:hypothetical protein L0F63_000557 [Massospora cicadina]|nr:hypothetical protein L0F63_000557 [Massospora cicadina]
MGIAGLLPILKPITRAVSLEAYRGQTVGVDAYVWLYRAMHGCAYDHGLGVFNAGYLRACKRWLDMFEFYGVTPYLVFDGRRLPAKAGTETERQQRRERMLQLALQHHHNGDTQEATDCFQRALDITPQIALGLIQVLKDRELPYIVAPYEADAQLAFLSRNGYLAAVVSEDSDLLVYECPRVIFKLDACGSGVEIRYEELNQVPELSQLVAGGPAKFRHLCILSGCDYLPSVPGVGLKTANKLITSAPDYLAAIRKLKLNPRFKVPDHYARDFVQAEMTFRFQWVYDPASKRVVHLTEPPELLAEHAMLFLGEPATDPKLMEGLVAGLLHPDTLEPVKSPDAHLDSPSLGSPFGVEVFSDGLPTKSPNAKDRDPSKVITKLEPVLKGPDLQLRVVTPPQSRHFGSKPQTNPFSSSGRTKPFSTMAILSKAETIGNPAPGTPSDSPTVSHFSLASVGGTQNGTQSGGTPIPVSKRSLLEPCKWSVYYHHPWGMRPGSSLTRRRWGSLAFGRSWGGGIGFGPDAGSLGQPFKAPLATAAPRLAKRAKLPADPPALGDLDGVDDDSPAAFP